MSDSGAVPVPQCRICFRPAGGDIGPLVVPCCCVGASRYVHSSCLNKQRLREGLLSESFWECSVCGAAYRMKVCGNVLWVLASWPSIVLLSVIMFCLIVAVASEIFQLVQPLLGMLVQEKPKDGQSPEPFVLELYFNGMDFGYWVGGLLVITLARKAVNANSMNKYSDLAAYVFFIPTLLLMTRDKETHHLAWVMLPIYAFWNTYFMLALVFSLFKALSSLFVGEQVVDFVCLPDVTDQPNIGTLDEACNGDNELCLCCWDLRARFQMKGCGHLVACSVCRIRLIYRQLKLDANIRSTPRMRLLTNKYLEETKVKCPLCRGLDVMVQA